MVLQTRYCIRFCRNFKKGAVPTINLLDELKNKQINYSDVFKIEDIRMMNMQF